MIQVSSLELWSMLSLDAVRGPGLIRNKDTISAYDEQINK